MTNTANKTASRFSYIVESADRSAESARQEFQAAVEKSGYTYAMGWKAERLLIAEAVEAITAIAAAIVQRQPEYDPFDVLNELALDALQQARVSGSTSPFDVLAERAKLEAAARVLREVRAHYR